MPFKTNSYTGQKIHIPTRRQREKREMCLDLFDTPIARTTDPETSKAAAEETTKSGRRDALLWVVYEIVKNSKGITQHEIGPKTDLKPTQYYLINKRLSDLKNATLIYQDGKRNKCGIWWAK